MKLVHAADLHLDSPLRGLVHYEGAPAERLRRATRDALRALVDLCLEEQAALLLLAGDTWDGDWKDYATGLFFVAELNRLREVATRVVMVRGNHDAEARNLLKLTWPAHVTQLSERAPETLRFEELGVAVHGQSYARREVLENLALTYPDPLPGLLNIGLLHTNATGSAEHDPYAPCSVSDLVGRGYAYWALGHVHTAQVLSEAPWVVYPGNLQGRHARETGPKGAVVIEVSDAAVREVRPVTLDVVRWARVEVDAAALKHVDDALPAVERALDAALDDADGRPLAARVELVGTTPLHSRLQADVERLRAEVRGLASGLGGALWVEKVRLHTRAPVVVDAHTRDLRGAIARAVRELATSDEALHELLGCLDDVSRELARSGVEGPLSEPASLLPRVEALLLDGLRGDER